MKVQVALAAAGVAASAWVGAVSGAMAESPPAFDYAAVYRFPPPGPSMPPPQLASGPSRSEMVRAYPRLAALRQISGGAGLACQVDREQRLTNCRVTWESPEGYRFGEAALKLAKAFVLQPPPPGSPYDHWDTYSTVIAFGSLTPTPRRIAHSPSDDPPPAELSDIALPTGRLGVLGLNRGSLYLLGASNKPIAGQPTEITIVSVRSPINPYGVFAAMRFRVDCAAQTAQFLGLVRYNEFERRDGWQLSDSVSSPIRDPVVARAADFACRGAAPEPSLASAKEALAVVTAWPRSTGSQ